MNRLPFGIGDFIASFKGDTPGHEFHGNQYGSGSGGGPSDSGESGDVGAKISKLNQEKTQLVSEVNKLIQQKKKLYSNVDIESAMSAAEKKLDKDIADKWSAINGIVRMKRELSRGTSSKEEDEE